MYEHVYYVFMYVDCRDHLLDKYDNLRNGSELLGWRFL